MGSLSKSLALALILVLGISCASLLMVKPASAQTATPASSIPAPSVPQFTLKFIQAYYNTTNPPEGATEIIIKNQPFESLNNLTRLWYGVRLKGHSDENWTNVYSLVSSSENQLVPENASSENTVVVFPQWGFYVYGEVDFQVQAVILTAQPFDNTPFGTWMIDAISDWSATQTVNIPIFSFYPTPTQSSSTLTPTLTPVSSASNTSLLIAITISLIVIAFLLAVIIFLLIYMRKRSRLMGVNLKGYVSISHE